MAAKRKPRKRARRARPNPELLIMGGNPGKVFGREVHKVYYEHVTEGPRVHEFGPGVKMEALPDGSVRLFHPRKRIWEDLE